MNVEKHTVPSSGRLAVTRRLVERSKAANVLEIGGSDISFRDVLPAARWTMLDFSGAADLRLDLNVAEPRIPLPDSHFDLIVLTEVIEHLLWPHRVMQEVSRLLTEAGQCIVSVPNIASGSYRLAWLLGRIPSCAACGNLPPPELGPTTYSGPNGEEIGGHVIDFNRQRLTQLVRYAGFGAPTFHSSGLFWHRTVVPPSLCPVGLGSNLIAVLKLDQNHDNRFANGHHFPTH